MGFASLRPREFEDLPVYKFVAATASTSKFTGKGFFRFLSTPHAPCLRVLAMDENELGVTITWLARFLITTAAAIVCHRGCSLAQAVARRDCGFISLFTDFYRFLPIFTDFLGRLQPSKTTIQRTPDALGVEESSSPRRVLHFYCSNSSRGRMRAELFPAKGTLVT